MISGNSVVGIYCSVIEQIQETYTSHFDLKSQVLSLLIAVKFSERIRCGYEHKRALEKRPRVVTGKGQQEILEPS